MSAVCPECDGTGRVAPPDTAPTHYGVVRCVRCLGTGETSQADRDNYERGRALYQDRRGRNVTLRAEAQRLGITAAELSRRERGLE